jgi:hypothetical protein
LAKILGERDLQAISTFLKKKKRGQFTYPILTEHDEEVDKNAMQAKPLQEFVKYVDPASCKIHNHLGNNFHLANKNALFYNMRYYYDSIGDDVFNYLPLTFHIREGEADPEYAKFLHFYE